jgi:hypothetical protein
VLHRNLDNALVAPEKEINLESVIAQ